MYIICNFKRFQKAVASLVALAAMLVIMSCSASPPDSMMQNYVTIQSQDGKALYKSGGSLKDLMDSYWSPIAQSKIKCSKSSGLYEFSFKSKSYDKVILSIAENGALKKVVLGDMEIKDDKADAMHNVVMGLFQFESVQQ
jgi:hypothetical protein